VIQQRTMERRMRRNRAMEWIVVKEVEDEED
jgi:hypothetical protein